MSFLHNLVQDIPDNYQQSTNDDNECDDVKPAKKRKKNSSIPQPWVEFGTFCRFRILCFYYFFQFLGTADGALHTKVNLCAFCNK